MRRPGPTPAIAPDSTRRNYDLEPLPRAQRFQIQGGEAALRDGLETLGETMA